MENYLYLKEVNKMSNPQRYNVLPTLNDMGKIITITCILYTVYIFNI